MANKLLALIHDFLPADPGAQAGSAFAALTRREREIVELLSRGLDNAQIGAHLGLAEKTVRNNISIVFEKLGAENRAQAIVARATPASAARYRPRNPESAPGHLSRSAVAVHRAPRDRRPATSRP